MASQPTDGQRHRAQLAALYAEQPRARLISCMPVDDALMVTLGQPDGTAQLVRVVKLDQAELSVLPEQERNRIRHALASVHLKRAEAWLERTEQRQSANAIADSILGMGHCCNIAGNALATNVHPRLVCATAKQMELIARAAEQLRNALNELLPEGFEPPPEDLLPEGDDESP